MGCFFEFMKVHVLDDDLHFPPVSEAGEHGLLAVGGDLSPAGCWRRMSMAAPLVHGRRPDFVVGSPRTSCAPCTGFEGVQEHAQRAESQALSNHDGPCIQSGCCACKDALATEKALGFQMTWWMPTCDCMNWAWHIP